ncbi:MAG TPA: diguanylate cyclase response regulator [Candidatus Dormibacteraeota bacterium]|nr:diguanylate cyclase response regulator [Candidatus Dormibacteraeota bacterium]
MQTRVLLVEDNPGDARLVREALHDGAPDQFTVQVADSLQHALASLGPGVEEVDVILLDLSLPDSQGLETYRAIHARDPEVPVLVLSGLNDESVALKAVNEGAQDFLRKSKVDSELLPRAIRYAIERHGMLAQVRQLAVNDELTGLLNRRGFLLLAEHQRSLADRKGTSLGLVFIDVDRFKTINDTCGHEEGDRALKELAGLLQRTFRRSDVVARLGGDEFIVLMTDIKGAGVQIVLDRLAKSLAAFNHETQYPWNLSISLGVALYESAHPVTLEALMASADQSMYQAKAQSRLAS